MADPAFANPHAETLLSDRRPDPRAILRGTAAALLALSFLMPASLAAQGAGSDTTRTDTTVFRIEGVTAHVQRAATTVGGASAVELEVADLRLAAAAPTADVLRKIRGVHVRTNSRGQAEISVRGSESRQVAVFLDGVPLTLGYDARTDLSVLPSTALDEIGFVRGVTTLLGGPNVLGGVIEMDIARGTMPVRRSIEVLGSVDNVGAYSTAARGTFPFSSDDGRGMVRAGIGFRDSPGMPLPGDVEEPVPTGDDLRLNTDYQNIDGFVAFGYQAEGGAWASLSATTHSGDRGIAAELGAEDPRLWRYPEVSRTIVATSVGTGDRNTPFGRGDLEASVGWDSGVTSVRSYETRDYDVVNGIEDGDDRTLSLRLLADHTLGLRGELRTAFTYAGIRHDETVDGEFREFEQRLMSLAGETIWKLLDRPGAGVSALNLSFGAAWDRATTPLTGGLESLPTIQDWGARAGVSALLHNGGTILHASASRRGRFPALRESYSEALDRFEPNPDLEPEHLVSVEAGVTSRVGNGEVQLVGFRQSLTDAIRRISLPGGKRQRVNSEELESVGLELYFAQTFGRFDVGGEVTLQSVELTDPATSTNAEPENVPETSGSLFTRIPLGGGFESVLEGEYTGSQFCIDPDSGEDVELDSGTWLNASLSKVWSLTTAGAGRRIETSVSASNLGDTAVYDSCGLPRAGRLFRFQVRIF